MSGKVGDDMVEAGAQALSDYLNRGSLHMSGTPNALDHHRDYARIVLEAALSASPQDGCAEQMRAALDRIAFCGAGEDYRVLREIARKALYPALPQPTGDGT